MKKKRKGIGVLLIGIAVAGFLFFNRKWNEQYPIIQYDAIEVFKEKVWKSQVDGLKSSLLKAMGFYGFEREIVQGVKEVKKEEYIIREGKEIQEDRIICYPVIEIQKMEGEKEKIETKVNQFIYEEASDMGKEYAQSVTYEIFYINERYLDICYRVKEYKKIITIDLQTGQHIFILEDLWIDDGMWNEMFDNSQKYYYENNQMELLLECLQNSTKTEFLEKRMLSYYITEDRIGVNFKEGVCLEMEYDWKRHVADRDAFIYYEEEEKKKEEKRDTYEIKEKQIDIHTIYNNYREGSLIEYPVLKIEDKEKETKLNEFLYDIAVRAFYLPQIEEDRIEYFCVEYEITYAEEDYISILYSFDSSYRGITIDTRTWEPVSLEELGYSEEIIENSFLEAQELYTEKLFELFWFVTFKYETREEKMAVWKEKEEHKEDYYLKEDRIGLIFFYEYPKYRYINLEIKKPYKK